ncbi:hypothetical protein AEMCBJ_09285 [Cupriavidus necator]
MGIHSRIRSNGRTSDLYQIGAGGAGKTMAYAIAREQPVELVIHNRSAGRAAELAEGGCVAPCPP